MAYKTKDAAKTLLGYLKLTPDEITYIQDTDNRGFEFVTNDGEKIVIFIYPISHKQDDTKNFFDTRDSGAYERGIAWQYACEKNLKYFCLGVHDQVEKYKDYIFSLECHEERIAEVSGTVNGSRMGKGTQVVIPNNYIPSKAFDRICTQNGFYISVVNKDNIWDYLKQYDNRPYMRAEDCSICLETTKGQEKDYSAQELGEILKQMYENAGKNLKVAAIFMFGLKYAEHIIEKNISASEVIKSAGLSESYSAEISNALNIYRCIDQNLYGFCFADKKDTAEEDISNINYKTGIEREFSENRILFGAPGTGKSHTLEDDRKELLYNDREVDETKLDLSQYGSYERVTFHPDYSYANFVGTYKPVPAKDKDGNDTISYEYVAGPFVRTLVKALQSGRTENPKPYLLIIEEINRANAAAVFGDVFQLLDRKDGVSEYAIQTSRELREYLAKPENLGGNPDDYEEIRIPDNMFIWATMNSADQGVYPMDTAFKRRWDFKYIDINEGQSVIEDDNVGVKGQIVNWNKLRIAINDLLENDYGVNEDKLMGPFFITPAALRDDLFEDAFKNKVLMYLCEDVLRHRGGEKLFDIDMKHLSYAKVCKAFDEKGIDIFVKDVRDEAVISVPEKKDKAGDAE